MRDPLKKFQQMVAKAPQFVASLLNGLQEYSNNQSIPLAQALDEAIFILPRKFPEGICNLTDWIPRCEEVGIRHIPIEKGPSISIEELEQYFEKSDMESANITAIQQFIAEAYKNGKMWRWNVCGAEPLKLIAGLRRTNPEHHGVPLIDFKLDERFFHIVWEDQATITCVVARPWIQAEMDDGFPVEFRVFQMQDGAAACNYYPQRALNPKYSAKMEEAVELTKQLAKSSNCPKEFSCDWLLGADGHLYFLEGGPPHTPQGGAHPCCFALGKVQAGRRLLESEPGAQFYFEPAMEAAIQGYKDGKYNYERCCQLLRLPPKVAATIFAVKGIIPREMAEKVIRNKASQSG